MMYNIAYIFFIKIIYVFGGRIWHFIKNKIF